MSAHKILKKTLEKEIGAVAVEKLTSSKETYTPGSMAQELNIRSNHGSDFQQRFLVKIISAEEYTLVVSLINVCCSVGRVYRMDETAIQYQAGINVACIIFHAFTFCAISTLFQVVAEALGNRIVSRKC